MAPIKLQIRSTAVPAFEAEIDDEDTVETLGVIIFSLQPELGAELRLAHKGRILNDADVIKDVGMKSGDAVAVARKVAGRLSVAGAQSVPQPSPATTSAQTTTAAAPGAISVDAAAAAAAKREQAAKNIAKAAEEGKFMPLGGVTICFQPGRPTAAAAEAAPGEPAVQQETAQADTAASSAETEGPPAHAEPLAQANSIAPAAAEAEAAAAAESNEKAEATAPAAASEPASQPEAPASAAVKHGDSLTQAQAEFAALEAEVAAMTPAEASGAHELPAGPEIEPEPAPKAPAEDVAPEPTVSAESLRAMAGRVDNGSAPQAEVVKLLRSTAERMAMMESVTGELAQALQIVNMISARTLQGLGGGGPGLMESLQPPKEEAPKSYMVKRGDDLQEEMRRAQEARPPSSPTQQAGGVLSAGAPKTKEEMQQAREARLMRLEAQQAEKKQQQADAEARGKAREAMFERPFTGTSKGLGKH